MGTLSYPEALAVTLLASIGNGFLGWEVRKGGRLVFVTVFAPATRETFVFVRGHIWANVFRGHSRERALVRHTQFHGAPACGLMRWLQRPLVEGSLGSWCLRLCGYRLDASACGWVVGFMVPPLCVDNFVERAFVRSLPPPLVWVDALVVGLMRVG